LQGVPEGTYHASIRQNGDISRGVSSVGDIWDLKEGSKNHIPRGRLGQIEVGKLGIGSVLLDSPVEIWELIGRSMVVSRASEAKQEKNDETTFVGVIARSAGVWENDKMVSQYQHVYTYQVYFLHLISTLPGWLKLKYPKANSDGCHRYVPAQEKLCGKNARNKQAGG